MSGVTKPILTSSPISAAVETDVVVPAAAVVSVEAPVVVVLAVAAAAVVVVFVAAAGGYQATQAGACADGGARDARDLKEVAAADGLCHLRTSLRTFLGASLTSSHSTPIGF